MRSDYYAYVTFGEAMVVQTAAPSRLYADEQPAPHCPSGRSR